MLLFKEPKIITIVRSAVLGIISVIFIVMGIIGVVRVNKDPIDLNDTHMDWNQLQNGQHVEMDVNILIGYYMTTTNNGRETQRDYLMPHVIYDSHNNYYSMDRLIGVKINSSDINTADTIVNNTASWWRARSGEAPYNTVTIHVDGYLRKMTDEQIRYAREAMNAAGFTAHDQAAMIVPYYISDNSSSGSAFLICGIITAICSAGLLIYAIKKK